MSRRNREKLVAHRVSPEEYQDLVLVAEVKGLNRSELLRALVRQEKKRIVEGQEEEAA